MRDQRSTKACHYAPEFVKFLLLFLDRGADPNAIIKPEKSAARIAKRDRVTEKDLCTPLSIVLGRLDPRDYSDDSDDGHDNPVTELISQLKARGAKE